jgi:hypothetical protein
MNALQVITDAYEWLNRLSPGETLNADDAAKGFARLNTMVDLWSAQKGFLFQSVETSAAQTGNITLGAGSWAAIAPGSAIIAMEANNVPVSAVTMTQYSSIFDTTTTGLPYLFAHDGLSNVYMVPVPNGQTIKILTGKGVSSFADQTTEYTVPQGYAAALGISLAVSLAPPILGGVPAELLRERKAALNSIKNYEPAVIDYSSKPTGNILSGWR